MRIIFRYGESQSPPTPHNSTWLSSLFSLASYSLPPLLLIHPPQPWRILVARPGPSRMLRTIPFPPMARPKFSTVRTGLVLPGTNLSRCVRVINGSWIAYNLSSLRQGTFTYVTGTFKAPKAQGPDGFASMWVGIDGFTCPTAILQTGISIAYSKGVTQYTGMLILIFKRLPQYSRASFISLV